MNIRQIQEARELYGIDEWGAGYFGINDEGHVVSHPTGEEHLSVSLPEVIAKLKSQGIHTPLILRFPQIVECQLERMHSAFRQAIGEFNFKGKHIGVFPFKVNQRREFIDAVVSCGQRLDYGLEVGSKTEFVAALSYPLSPNSLLICNGFKDREFIDMAFLGAAMGKRVIVVVEGPDELGTFIDLAKNHAVVPEVGLRVRLYSKGSGKWEKSSGDSSKFGLTTTEVLNCLAMLEEAQLKDRLAMLHFHIGSQITEIKRFKNAIKEASRVYAKVVKMGYSPTFLNIGGGVGVDYDGSKTSFLSSANYTMQEFANDAVYVLGDVCANEGVKYPTIVTESGRVIAAYHSVVVTDIREVQGEEALPIEADLPEYTEGEVHKSIKELKYILDNINRKNYVEFYHDAIEYQEELFTLFNLGYLNLADRAYAEDLFRRVCRRALYFSSFQRHQLEEFDDLQKVMVSKYLANFSMFQSIPDSWAIDQLFPVMPLSRHDEKPSHKATIVDITCDSDGCLDTFVDRADVKTALDLHVPNNQPYYIGFFLVGAYQESLANEHNLFGAIHEAEIYINADGDWEITKVTKGDPIDELLQSRNYDLKEMFGCYELQFTKSVAEGRLSEEQAQSGLERLGKFMRSYPYLIDL
ncbi:MAG: biosynthetic arginine decarboxylase [Deltaproteobacteria bacterium]|nr:biosynthetic arginine decarboxylase [Deltaproteobacteria bacterium]